MTTSSLLSISAAIPTWVNRLDAIVETICPPTPCYMVPTHFAAGKLEAARIHAGIAEAIALMKANHPDSIDSAFFPKVAQWRLKYLQGSHLREIHVNCYWDEKEQDHFIELNRIKGDGLFPAMSDFYSVLQRSVLGDKYVPPRAVPGRRPFSGVPPPRVPSTLTEEKFLTGMKPIFCMARDNFFEPRIEAAKALCDLSKREDRLLNLDFCVHEVVDCLNGLIVDEFQDIQQFAIVACSLFAAKPKYQQPLRAMPSIYMLVHLLLQYRREVPGLEYEFAQMRRKAALSLQLLMDETIVHVFNEQGVESVADFRARLPATEYFDPAPLETAFDNQIRSISL